MTTADLIITNWATTVVGKATRIALAALGMIVACLTLMLAPLVSPGSWLLVLAGVALVATAVRAARLPTVTRLAGMVANLAVIPFITQLG